jgi:hypothetical protein
MDSKIKYLQIPVDTSAILFISQAYMSSKD